MNVPFSADCMPLRVACFIHPAFLLPHHCCLDISHCLRHCLCGPMCKCSFCQSQLILYFMPFLSSACLNPQHVDFVGLITALLTLHLTEPQSMQRMDPHISTMLSCLEDAFAHFESAKKGRLDRCEVEDALLEESSKAATKDGKHAATRTGHRLASKLFESIRECVGFVQAGLRRMQMMLTVFVTTVEAAGAHTCYQHCASAFWPSRSCGSSGSALGRSSKHAYCMHRAHGPSLLR